MMFGAAVPTLVSLLGDDPDEATMSADDKIDRFLLVKQIAKDMQELPAADQNQIASLLMGDDYMGSYADLVMKLGQMGKGVLKGISKSVKKRKDKKKGTSKLSSAISKVQTFINPDGSTTDVAAVPSTAARKPASVWILPAAVGAVALVGVFALTRKKKGRR